MEKVLSSHVGVKINEWYKMIRQFSVPDAEILKAEVEWEIDSMMILNDMRSRSPTYIKH
nr:hypothetical protein [Bacillus sp. UNC125MFCrub1.1]